MTGSDDLKVMDSSRQVTWRASEGLINGKKVKWAINNFKPYKSPGSDQIVQALPQRGIKILLPTLVLLFRASYSLGYQPKAWRNARVVYIPKAGKDSEQPKSYRPISLTSFLLKTLEKLIDLHIRLQHLKRHSLHPKKFAYQAGKSTVSALHHLVRKVENVIRHKEVTLTAFIDIEGAFDNTGFESIRPAAKRRQIEPETVEWIIAILENRIFTTQLGQDQITIKTTRGSPQGGVLSPLLSSLVINELLTELTVQGYEVIGFADDLVIMIRGNGDSILSNCLQSALNHAMKWCKDANLSINPMKTVVIPFTRRLKHNLKEPRMGDVTINYSEDTKYLGITLDSKPMEFSYEEN
jgi:Reverse transcriptase (RNA-dependent DNA polymerase)